MVDFDGGGVVLEWPAMGNMPVPVRVLCLVQTHQV